MDVYVYTDLYGVCVGVLCCYVSFVYACEITLVTNMPWLWKLPTLRSTVAVAAAQVIWMIVLCPCPMHHYYVHLSYFRH